MLTYQQAEYWITPLFWFCLLTIIVSCLVTIAAFFFDQHRKRIARLAVMVLGGLALCCCALFLFLAGNNQGLAIIVLIAVDFPIALLILLSGLLLVFRK